MSDNQNLDPTPADPSARSIPDTAVPGGSYRLGDRAVARIGYGAMGLEKFEHTPADGVALLRQAMELGVNHIDTADFYGHSVVNRIIQQAIRPSDPVSIVSKVGAVRVEAPVPIALAQRPDQLRAQVEANLRTLGRDRIDVVNLRRADVGPGLIAEGDQLVDVEDQLAELVSLREEGLIGAIGLSAVTPEIAQRALPAGIACAQNSYSLIAASSSSCSSCVVRRASRGFRTSPSAALFRGCGR